MAVCVVLCLIIGALSGTAILLSLSHRYKLGGYIYPDKIWSNGWQASESPLDYLDIGDLFFDQNGHVLLEDPRTTIKSSTFWSQIRLLKHKPSLMLSVSMGGYKDGDMAWASVLSDGYKYRRLSNELVQVMEDYQMQGLAVDWEPNPANLPPDVNMGLLRKNFNEFAAYFKTLKVHGKTGLLSVTVGCSDESTLASWKNRTFDFDGLVPYLDRLEVMCYFKPSMFLKNVPKIFGIHPSKVFLGIGFSSYSFGQVSGGECSSEINNDWGAYCPDKPGRQCPANGVYPSWSGDANNQNKWDVYPALIKERRALYRISKSGYPYLFFPADAKPSVLPWVSLDIAEEYAKLVKDAKLGGMFIWIVSSDSPDGKMTKAIRSLLDGKTVRDRSTFPTAKKCT